MVGVEVIYSIWSSINDCIQIGSMILCNKNSLYLIIKIIYIFIFVKSNLNYKQHLLKKNYNQKNIKSNFVERVSIFFK